MSPRSLSLLSTMALVVVATIAAQTARGQQQTPTRIATFEIAATDVKESIAEAAQSTLAVLERRLDDAGRARVDDDNRIEVELYGDLTPDQYAALLRRITAVGALEFRITASRQFKAHQSLIELAETLPVDQISVRLHDQDVARWVASDGKEYPSLERAVERGLIARKVGDAFQVLVLTNDGFDVTGDDLKSVEAGLDVMGKPDLGFTFNPNGAQLFGQLTGTHLPTASGQRFELGIVLDNRLLSAPTIMSRITDRGRISGNFSQADIDFLVAVLKAGRLPYPLKLIAERTIAK
jgi:SecD/SecF fusion protein